MSTTIVGISAMGKSTPAPTTHANTSTVGRAAKRFRCADCARIFKSNGSLQAHKAAGCAGALQYIHVSPNEMLQPRVVVVDPDTFEIVTTLTTTQSAPVVRTRPTWNQQRKRTKTKKTGK